MEILIDLSNITGEREQYFLDLAMNSYPLAMATVVAPESSVISFGDMQVRSFSSTRTPTERSEFFREVFLEFSSKAALDSLPEGGKRIVISFQLDVQSMVSEVGDARLLFQDFRSIVFPPKVSAWPEGVMSLTEAIEILVQAISVEKNACLRMSSFRPALERVDDRFAKMSGNPLSAPGIIKLLIHAAQEQGYVEVGGSDDSNPLVFLKRSHVPSNSKFSPSSPTPVTQLPSPQSSKFAHESTDSLSERFITCLRNANLGPFQDVRTAIYREIDAISVRRLPAFQLINESVNSVRNKVETARQEGRQYLVTSKRNLPWSKVVLFMGELMRQVPCIRLGEEFVPLRLTYMNCIVDGMAENWFLALDSILLLHLIDEGYEVGFSSITDLSGALYNTRHDLTQSRTLIDYVLNTNMCIEDERMILRRP